jgi:hypothetical protein
MTSSPVPPGITGRPLGGLVVAVLARPSLWWPALGALRRMAAPGWWRRAPYLPVPDRHWWGFRMVTAYGRADAAPTVEDVVSYLRWYRSTTGSDRTAPH